MNNSKKIAKTLEFSKKLMISTSVIFILTWLAAIVSWFLYKELPIELLWFASLPFTVSAGCYYCAEAYEKKGGRL